MEARVQGATPDGSELLYELPALQEIVAEIDSKIESGELPADRYDNELSCFSPDDLAQWAGQQFDTDALESANLMAFRQAVAALELGDFSASKRYDAVRGEIQNNLFVAHLVKNGIKLQRSHGCF